MIIDYDMINLKTLVYSYQKRWEVEEKTSLIYKRMPANKCRRNDIIRTLPYFYSPNVINDSGKDY